MNAPKPESESPQDAIESAAIEWLLEKAEGFEAGRAEAFEAWCEADHRHAVAVAQAESAMSLLTELPQVSLPLRARLAEADGDPAQAATARGGPPRLILWAAGIAAAVIVSTTVWWSVANPASEERQFVAGVNSPRQVALNDGSLVAVNSNSSVQVRMMRHERHVELNAGEAHFEVAHDPARPFIVVAGGISVRAVGTAFNVRIRDKDVEVLVVEGRVEISNASELRSSGTQTERPQVGAFERVVAPRDQAVAKLVVEKVGPTVVQKALAWHGPVTNFSNRPLREIVSLFNRHNPIQLVLVDPELGDREVGGFFAIDQPLAFVRLMEKDGDIVAEARGKSEIVLRRSH